MKCAWMLAGRTIYCTEWSSKILSSPAGFILCDFFSQPGSADALSLLHTSQSQASRLRSWVTGGATSGRLPGAAYKSRLTMLHKKLLYKLSSGQILLWTVQSIYGGLYDPWRNSCTPNYPKVVMTGVRTVCHIEQPCLFNLKCHLFFEMRTELRLK